VPTNQTPPPSGQDVAASAIFKAFLGKAEGYLRQPTRMKQLLTDAYHKASEKNEVGTLAHEAWETLQTLFRLIKASMAGEYTGVPTTTVVAAVAVLLYFLSPIDFIPDFIPVLGLLDDVALVAWFSTTVKSEIDRFHEWELTRPALMAAKPQPQEGGLQRATPATEAPKPSPAGGHAQPETESAKHAGTTHTSTSNTDAGIGSPDSSSPRPVHEAGPDATPTPGTNIHADPTAQTTDSSRNRNDGPADTGGNIR
jgi:uncharacterized membrane protein YkvA (DUF1232 family)